VFAEFCDGLADFPGLLDPEDEGTKILRNIGKCLPTLQKTDTGSICVTCSVLYSSSGRCQGL
jgi:hypothetical protein